MAADNGLALAATLWSLTLASGIILGLRVFAKISRGRCLWWDDYIVVLSWLLLFVATCLMQRAVSLGFGHHSSTLSVDSRFEIATYSVLYSAGLTVIVALARISFAVALLRCTDRRGRVTAWVVIGGLVCITMVPLVIARFTICTPFQKVYGAVVDGYCGNTYIPLYIGWASGAWSAASDFALAILAWRCVWAIKMRPQEKIGVAVALSFGILSGALTVFRYVYVALIYAQDFYEDGYFGFIWVAAEAATSMIAASIPALRAFIAERSHFRLAPACSQRQWPTPAEPPVETIRNSSSSLRKPPGRTPSASSASPKIRSRPESEPKQKSVICDYDYERNCYRYRQQTDRDIIFSNEWDRELQPPGRHGQTPPPPPRPCFLEQQLQRRSAVDSWAYFTTVPNEPDVVRYHRSGHWDDAPPPPPPPAR